MSFWQNIYGYANAPYQGPVPFISDARSPTSFDTNYPILTLWFNSATLELYFLGQKTSNLGYIQADWIHIASSAGNTETLTGNTGGAVGPDTNANINVKGDGTTITVTGNPGTNTLTISAISGGFTWNNVTGTSATMAKENGYAANNAGLVTLTLPSTASSTFGDTIKIMGFGAGGWTIVYDTGQQIIFGSAATTATTGSLSSTNQYDEVTIICSPTTSKWVVESSIGNLTVV